MYKFMAWNEEHKMMMEPQILGEFAEYWSWDNKENLIFLQYIGINDCKGQEIYEGFIIKYKYYHANRRWWNSPDEIPEIKAQTQKQKDDWQYKQDVIKFREGQFQLGYSVDSKYLAMGEKFEQGQHHSCDYQEKSWDFEIIGNIYQHNDLLKNPEF